MKAVKAKNGQIYVRRSFRKDGKCTSENYCKLGDLEELKDRLSKSEEEVMEWADTEAKRLTDELKNNKAIIKIDLDPTKIIDIDKDRSFNCSHLFLLKILYDLKIDKISRYIKDHNDFTYDINRIMIDLICARILDPASKRSSYGFAKTLLSKPEYELYDIYRALDVLASNSDYIQKELYKNTNFITKRNSAVLYYDCTNYYFEIEDEDDFRRYGKSKEHRPNPIVTMGLFLDGDGIPLSFDIFEGNMNEQLTLKPLEAKIIRDFDYKEFIYCSDSGLASKVNKNFNSIQNRHYVITQSIKKLKKEYKDQIFDTHYYKKLGSDRFIDLKDIDREDIEAIYYKEIPVDDKETLIITYSPKYAIYQRKIREAQIKRAIKMINDKGKIKGKRNNPNDPLRFVKEIDMTKDGEIAEKKDYMIDEEKIDDEAKYDGYYAVSTDLDCDPYKIIKINKGRWQIEECFRVMKSEFDGRPVYVRKKDHIKAHFLICFMALLVFRLLEKKLDHRYTTKEIINTLRDMKLTLISDAYYIPSYKRTKITDDLHDRFGFRTDYEIIRRSNIRTILKNIKNR